MDTRKFARSCVLRSLKITSDFLWRSFDLSFMYKCTTLQNVRNTKLTTGKVFALPFAVCDSKVTYEYDRLSLESSWRGPFSWHGQNLCWQSLPFFKERRFVCKSFFFEKLFDDSPFTVGGFQCLLTHIQHGNREIWRLWAALSLASLQVIWFQDWRSCSGFLREISVQASELFGRHSISNFNREVRFLT